MGARKKPGSRKRLWRDEEVAGHESDKFHVNSTATGCNCFPQARTPRKAQDARTRIRTMIETCTRHDALDGESRTTLLMDQTDWEIVEIEAKAGGVTLETARTAIDQADRLAAAPDATDQELRAALRGTVALFQRHVPPPMSASPLGPVGLARKRNC